MPQNMIAKWWEALPNNRVVCSLCPRRCQISVGARGSCRVRENRDGQLYSLVYGRPIAVHLDPIEKKPLYHFYPGSQILSVGTSGCNLACEFCQNWELSHAKDPHIRGDFLSAERIVTTALRSDCIGIAFTYNEPTVFGEYLLEIATLAKEKDLKTVMVTNGYITPEAVRDIYPFIDAANIDLKGFTAEFYRKYCGGELQAVLDSILEIRKHNTHIELTTLLIPGLNDSEEEIWNEMQWIVQNLDRDVPLHFSAFHPAYRLQNLPRTPKSTLDKACQLARKAGIQYVYEGNVMTTTEDNTYCPQCGNLLIERSWFSVNKIDLREGKCRCGAKIAVVQD